ncbi:MAG: winged helix-turn-helix transcriptional regulator, partial [Halobacteriales archaeon]|nr:winged helix-turn-helix transcriptional regulator [Halobacteriales archaeon]
GAVVQEASFRSFHDDGGARGAMWDWVLSDGDGRPRIFMTHRSTGPVGGPSAEMIHYRTGIQVPDDPVPHYQYLDDDPWEGAVPMFRRPDQLPSVPSVASLEVLYHALTGRVANAWGISPHCAVSCYHNDGPYLTVGETHENSTSQWRESDIFFGSGQEGNDLRRSLYVNAVGTLIGWRADDVQDRYGPDLKPKNDTLVPLAFSIGPTQPGTVWAWRLGGAAAATGLASLVAAFVYWFWPSLKTGALSLFSRIHETQVPNHPRRQRILEVIVHSPGIHLRELALQSGMGLGTLRYHLGKLRAVGAVRSERRGGYVCHYLPGQPRTALPRSMQSPGYQAVATAREENPTASVADLAHRTGLAESTVRYHLRRLCGQST